MTLRHVIWQLQCLLAVLLPMFVSQTISASAHRAIRYTEEVARIRHGNQLRVLCNALPVSQYFKHLLLSLIWYCTDFPDQGCVIGPSADGSGFCCQASWNGSACAVPNGNSYTPFTIGKGEIINNRTDGSTSPNTTVASSLSTASCSVAATTTVTAPADKASGGHELAIGLGVGLPLGIALIAALFMLWKQSKSKSGAVSEPQAVQSLPPYNSQSQTSQVKPKHELYAQPVSELSGGP